MYVCACSQMQVWPAATSLCNRGDCGTRGALPVCSPQCPTKPLLQLSHDSQSTAISTYMCVHILHMHMKLLVHKQWLLKFHVHCNMHSTFLHCGRAETNSPYVHVHVCGAVYVSYCGSDVPQVHGLPARTGRQSTVLAGSNFWLTIVCTLPQACIHTL